MLVTAQLAKGDFKYLLSAMKNGKLARATFFVIRIGKSACIAAMSAETEAPAGAPRRA